MLFPGGESPPTISTHRPVIPSRSVGEASMPVVVIEIEDRVRQ